MGTRTLEKHYPWLYNIAMFFTRNVEDAEDLRHNVVIRALEKQHLFKGGSLKAWLYVMTRNMYINNLRKKIGDDRRAVLWHNVDRSVVITKVPDAVWEAIDMLPIKLKDVVLLRSKGLKHKEIATLLGIPRNTSMTRLRRGLRHVRKRLKCPKS